MKSECCHQHPDNGDLATQTPAQTEETDLRATNTQLLEALEFYAAHAIVGAKARAAIEEARK